MTKILMHGCNGAMGRAISDLLSDSKEAKIVAGVDLQVAQHYDYPVYSALHEVDPAFDVIIDFANVKAVDALLDYAKEKKKALVLCTTGLNAGQIQKVEDYAKEIAILRSANMSLGINLLLKLVKDAAKVLYPSGFDIEIVEKHHRRKLDAPSGTALALADSINEECNRELTYVYDRQSVHAARDHEQMGISAVRGGTIVGEHDVLFCGEDEIITLSHTAMSRKIFAKGAISAAIFLCGKNRGLFTMRDVINGKQAEE